MLALLLTLSLCQQQCAVTCAISSQEVCDACVEACESDQPRRVRPDGPRALPGVDYRLHKTLGLTALDYLDPHFVGWPETVREIRDLGFSTSQLWPVINAWQVASRTRFTAVYGGGDGVNDSHSTTGRIAVFRQNYLRTSQSMKIIDVPDAGPIKITKAPVGKRRGLNTLQGEAVLRFKGKRGLSGRFFLADYSVKLDSQP